MLTIIPLQSPNITTKMHELTQNQINLFDLRGTIGLNIRPYHELDRLPLLELISSCLPSESVDEALFEANVLSDANFRPAGLLLAEIQETLVGFVIAIAEPTGWDKISGLPCQGYITLFGVAESHRNCGIGTELLSSATEYLHQRGCTSIYLSPYKRGYFTPGVDIELYPHALQLLKATGFQFVSNAVSMECDFGQSQSVQELGLCIIRPYSAPMLTPLLQFLRKEFPGDWMRVVEETVEQISLGDCPANSLLVAMDTGEIIGFAHWRDERFGPIGVRSDARGERVGTALLHAGLDAMRRSGKKRAWFKWTDPQSAAKFYGPAGFVVKREFQLLRKEI